MAQVKEVPRHAAVDLVANTYGGYLAGLRTPAWRQEMIGSLHGLLDRMLADGLVEERDGILRLTMLGRACGESPLSLKSSLRAVELIRRFASAGITPEILLVLVEALSERDDDYTPQVRKGEAVWQQEAAQRFGPDAVRALRDRAPSDRDFYARCKRALIVSDWIGGVPTSEIEGRFSANPFVRIGPGDIRGYADGSRFLFEPVLRIAAIVLESSERPDEAADLLTRLDLGIPAAALTLTQVRPALSRAEILALWRAGLADPAALATATLDMLLPVLGRRARKFLLAIGSDDPASGMPASAS